ncbi:MAG: adenylyltransferase/cytidyltransferase family protein [Erysipelotrichaceae bacterium]|nr:adenylyltransferase/cytidyltransferase family protein [Erysipelotrichaceae bacterium]
MRIGIYCGSFDPIHNGHVKIIKTILKENIVDKIFIMPTDDYWNKKINLSFEERKKAISISLKRRVNKNKYIIEEELSKYQYTYLIFRDLKKIYPKDEFYLIMGGDNVLNFDKWKNYKELLENPFIVINRKNDDLEKSIKKLNPKKYYLLEIEGISDISSTFIRDNIDDYSKIKKMINEETYKYVYRKLKHE